MKVKREFVKVCTTKGTPTLGEVKDVCIDLIEVAFANVPRIDRHEDDIEKAETMTKLARVVCFYLSNWISYDFFNKVVDHFQPNLSCVKEKLMHYGDRLKPHLLQKLEDIAELQKR